MINPAFQTLLILDDIGAPLYSARGLTQTLAPIAAAVSQRRTINGVLHDVSYDQFRKYATKISCVDQRPPSNSVWPGRVVTVHCAVSLAYPVGGTPERTPVSGSEIIEGDFVFYRPVLTMQVTSITENFDEWAANVQWELDLEEV